VSHRTSGSAAGRTANRFSGKDLRLSRRLNTRTVVGILIQVRHLDASQAIRSLRRGASIAQLLPNSVPVDGRSTLTWLRASRRIHDGDSYTLGRHFTFDEGSPAFCDLWEFTPVNDDECLGEGVELAVFESAEALLDAAVTNYEAGIDRWVNQEMIQDEYRDLKGGHP
jgi:hypothetical protein